MPELKEYILAAIATVIGVSLVLLVEKGAGKFEPIDLLIAFFCVPLIGTFSMSVIRRLYRPK